MQDENLFKEYKKTLLEHKRNNEKVSKAYDLLYEDDDNITDVINDETLSSHEFIDVIALRRCEGYSKSAGGGNESAGRNTDRLYGKTPLKFVEEFLQNADDCQYDEEPRITINIDESHGTIEFDYNERGFSREDIWAITSFESSTKSDDNDRLLDIPETGVFFKEKTGRKGIGFKSVFSIKADNVIIHIRSNGYSFKLDNNIGRIIPVWENSAPTDNHTHVMVELVNSEESLHDIYPEFRKLFCVDQIEELFKRSPALFMHRIKDVTVNCISDSNKSFYIQLSTDGEPLYEGRFTPDAPILSGIAHKGIFYQSETADFIVVTHDSETGDQIFSCKRKTYMKKVDGKYRNISFMAPVMDGSDELQWKSGALFRTFPLFDETYDIPVSIDAPYELNTERRDIEYGEVGNSQAINAELSELIFCEDGLLADYYLTLREVSDIRIDYYLSRNRVVVFNKDGNKNASGMEIVPHRDFMSVLKTVPVFRSYEEPEKYVSYKNAVIADEKLFDWPEADKLMNVLFTSSAKSLVSKIYKGSKLLRSESVVDANFADHINRYLGIVENEYGIESYEFTEFMGNQLYPFLKGQSQIILKQNQWGPLCILMSRVKRGKNIVTCDESFDSKNEWVSVKSRKNNISLNNYRVIESSPVCPLIFKDEYRTLSVSWGKDIDFELGGNNNISRTAKFCKTATELIKLIEDALFYGFSIDKFQPELLNHYVLSEKYDPGYNPFRTTGVLDLVEDKDVEELALVTGVETNEAVRILKAHGIKNGEDLINEVSNYSELYPATTKLLGRLSPDDELVLFEKIFKRIKISEKKLNFSYDEVKNASLDAKLYIAQNRTFLSEEAFEKYCECVLSESSKWENLSEITTELILRSWRGATKTRLPKKYTVPCRISIERIISRKLYQNIRENIERRNFPTLEIYSEGSFSEIPFEEIYSYVSILAANRIEELSGKSTVFYTGTINVANGSDAYLYDTDRKHVFLNISQQGSFAESLGTFLYAKFDPDKLALINKLEEDVKEVKEKYILPALEETGHDNGLAFQILHDRFQSLPKATVIRILSWFRYQGYAEGLGNASKNNEKEIEDDYRENPWNFVYEFIQNVDDCSFPDGVVPSLRVSLKKSDNSISFEYNESGFTLKDIEAITQFGESNKSGVLDNEPENDGLFDRERTGRLGRGFKSVFALSNKNIVVHINSNEYTFCFNKRLGQIIPLWEDCPRLSKGTRITVNGFKDSEIDDIYNHLREVFSVDKPESLFANCPVLYLRKLRSIEVNNGTVGFRTDVRVDETQYSEDKYLLQNETIFAGIKEAGEYRKGLLRRIHISLTDGNNKESIPALQLSVMFSFRKRTSVATVTAPVITDKNGKKFCKGAFYRTLPLQEEQIDTPIAINAPFITDSGRKMISDSIDSGNDELAEVIKTKLLEPFYILLRSEPNILIDAYIPNSSVRLFYNYKNIREFNLSSFIKKLPIIPLYSRNGFISCNDGRRLPEECYLWQNPVALMRILTGDNSDILADNGIRNIGRVNIVDADFAKHINIYLDLLERDGVDVYALLRERIIPFLTEHYDDIDAQLYRLKNKESLKELKVFAFAAHDNTYFRETASDDSIWLVDCPKEYKSYGKYRSLSSAPVKYSNEVMNWASTLHKPVSFAEAFDKNTLGTSNAVDWESTKQLIETIIYYQIKGNFRIPFLRKCAMIPQYDPDDNIFRTAYLTLKNNNIVRHYITDDDLFEIWEKVGDARECEDEDIAKTILRLGLRRGDDFFNQSDEGNVSFDKLTLDLFKEYCVDLGRSNTVIKSIEKKYKESFNGKIISSDYCGLRSCSPGVFCALFSTRSLPDQFLKAIAKSLFDDEEKTYYENDDFSEAVLRGCTYLEKETYKRRIRIKLSEVVKRHLGRETQNATFKHSENLELNIIPDLPTEDYAPDYIEKALDWLSTYEDKEDFRMSYRYCLADISGAFTSGYKRAPYLVDSSTVFLDRRDAQSSLITFVKDRYRTEDSTFTTLVDVITRQNRLKGNWEDSKKAYIQDLKEFRKETRSLGEILYPGMEKNINAANGNAIDYIIPELLQNINDCHYSLQGVRVLDIMINTRAGQMLLSYEEDGFTYANVYSITALGQSSKHDQSEGEKGLGFKKVFTLFDSVEIYSNGFCFELKKDENTVPNWIDDTEKISAFVHSGKTTMVFYTKDIQRLKKLEDKWEGIFKSPFVGNTESPLFIENISEYKLKIDNRPEKRLTRSEIERDYLIKNEKIISLYEKLLHDNGKSFEEEQIIMADVTEKLRSRTKCRVMSEDEFKDYLNSISVTIALPRKLNKDIKGYFYSTLPTSAETHTSMFINLPLELSTGRNEVMDESAFNRCIMQVVFGNKNTDISIVNMLLQILAEEHPDKEIFLYLTEHISAYVKMLADKTGQSIDEYEDALDSIKIFHAYPDMRLVPFSQCFSLDPIIYRYLSKVGNESANDIFEWIRNYTTGLESFDLIYVNKDIDQTCAALRKFNTDLDRKEGYVPLQVEDVNITADYFVAEYGSADEEEDDGYDL